MLEYGRSDISERNKRANKTRASKECDICHYWFFKYIGFKCEPYLRNRYRDLMQRTMTFIDFALNYVKGIAYRIHFSYMSKDRAISTMNNSNLIDKKFVFFFLL